MTHTFDIRFARSAGLMGLLEAPANSFRWKGGGHLRIDARGISFATRRSVLSFLRRTRRVEAADLCEIWREGDALRFEFTTAGEGHAVVPFWARDREAAAQIVRLLPTTRTIELEHDTSLGRAGGFRLDWRPAIALALIAGASAWGLALLDRDSGPAVLGTSSAAAASASRAAVPQGESSHSIPAPVDVALPAAAQPEVEPVGVLSPAGVAARDPGSDYPAVVESTEPTTLPASPPAAQSTADEIPGTRAATSSHERTYSTWNVDITPFPPGGWEHQHARIVLGDFEKLSRPLTDTYATIYSTRAGHAQNLIETLAMGWWEITFLLLADERLAQSGMADFRAALLASARHQRHYLALLAGTTSWDTQYVQFALLNELKLASEALSHAKRYVR